MSHLRFLFGVTSVLCVLVCGLRVEAQEISTNAVVRVQLDKQVPLKPGALVRAHTMEAIYEENRMAIPQGTPIEGRVERVVPAPSRDRMNARLHGDFTPLHRAQIRFDHFVTPDGRTVPVDTDLAAQGAEVVHFRSTSVKQPSLAGRLKSALASYAHNSVSVITAPGKSERMERFLYSQLPWHPEYIDRGTQYDVTLRQPLPLGNTAQPAQSPSHDPREDSANLHARLLNDLSSKTARPGDPVVAVVTTPEIDSNNHVQVPQGALLRGRVLQAQKAGSLGRNGELRFTFDRIDFPSGPQESMVGVPSAVDSHAATEIQLDTEGGAKAQTNKGVMMPLMLGLLAASALTEDEAGVGHAAASSNGFGLIARLVAVSSGSHVVGGAIGAVATGRSIYSRFIAHGKDVVFPRETGIEVEVSANQLSRPTKQNHVRGALR